MTTKPPDVEPAAVVDIFTMERAANEGSAAYRHWRWKQPPMGAPPPASPYRRSILAWAWDFGWRLAKHMEAKFDPDVQRAALNDRTNAETLPGSTSGRKLKATDDPPQGEGWFGFRSRA